MSSTSIVLGSLSVSGLPSQAGRRGRPRKSGRVTVEGAALQRASVQATLAERFGLNVSQVLFYKRESDENRQTFVVPGVSVDTRLTFQVETAS